MQDTVTALLYALVMAAVTFLYVDHENIELFKHPLSVLITPHDEAESE